MKTVWQGSFTLFELLAVIAIIGVLIGLLQLGSQGRGKHPGGR